MSRIPDMLDHNGRRAWAFLALLGGCIVMTIFAAVGVYLVSGNAKYSLYLALAAHAQVFVGLSGLTALLVRRSVKITKSGAEVEDHEVRGEETNSTLIKE